MLDASLLHCTNLENCTHTEELCKLISTSGAGPWSTSLRIPKTAWIKKVKFSSSDLMFPACFTCAQLLRHSQSALHTENLWLQHFYNCNEIIVRGELVGIYLIWVAALGDSYICRSMQFFRSKLLGWCYSWLQWQAEEGVCTLFIGTQTKGNNQSWLEMVMNPFIYQPNRQFNALPPSVGAHSEAVAWLPCSASSGHCLWAGTCQGSQGLEACLCDKWMGMNCSIGSSCPSLILI